MTPEAAHGQTLAWCLPLEYWGYPSGGLSAPRGEVPPRLAAVAEADALARRRRRATQDRAGHARAARASSRQVADRLKIAA